MILITRPSQPPAYAERAALGQTALEATAAEGGFKAQRRYDFDSSIWLAALEVLRESSYDKCAYCESQSGSTGPADIDHYRPKHRAEGLRKGEIHPDHYWWLAYSWDNLVFCCQDCSRNKRTRFPVIGKRLEPGDPPGAEQPLLLDPYGTDDPSEHLWFEDDGTVRAISDRGDVTIEVLALNRPNLVERRRDAAELMQSVLAAAPQPVPANTRAALIDPHVEYVALRRQLLERHLARAGTETAAEVLVPETVATVSPDIGAVWIEKVDIVNFGCFHELELRFSAPGEGYEPWIVVLGANGSGKSTILRAIALVLCSADARRRLVPDASKYVNRDTRARRGHVRIRFNQGDELRLEASRGSRHFTVTGRRPEFALAGYGSTRLLPHRTKSSRRATGPQLTNLFDPWASLANAEPWLADRRRVPPDDFKVLASSLKTLMSAEDEIELSRRSGKMRARMFDTIVDPHELSDGYQSILALSLDLSLAFGGEREQGFSTENFEGMVLIDELEVHLHPEWKMRVVSDLRSVFPHLQFVATTHDPLCLRGLQPGELHLLERRDDTITVQQIDVPSGLDADEILTGSWFGLDTTLDPKVQADLMQYRNLRLEGHGPDDPAVVDLQHRLELTLGSYTGTSLGRVMVEAAGELVAEQAAPAAPADTKLTKDQIKERLLAHARERTG